MEDDNVDTIEKKEKWLTVYFHSISRWINKNLPFQTQIQQIEAKFGTSVSCYFIFYRFIHIQFIMTTIFTLVFTILHILNLKEYHVDAFAFGASISPTFMNFSSFVPKVIILLLINLVVVRLLLLILLLGGLLLCINDYSSNNNNTCYCYC